LNNREIAALFFGDPDADLPKVYRAARQGGGTDDFSALVLARTDSKGGIRK